MDDIPKNYILKDPWLIKEETNIENPDGSICVIKCLSTVKPVSFNIKIIKIKLLKSYYFTKISSKLGYPVNFIMVRNQEPCIKKIKFSPDLKKFFIITGVVIPPIQAKQLFVISNIMLLNFEEELLLNSSQIKLNSKEKEKMIKRGIVLIQSEEKIMDLDYKNYLNNFYNEL